jgi:hypothetical protein
VARTLRQKRLLKLTMAAIAVAVFGLVFVRSLKRTAAEPYVVSQAMMTQWELALAPPDDRNAAILSLRSPLNSARGLFDQIFQRSMQSLMAQDPPLVPVVLVSEFNVALRRVFSDVDLLNQAERLGLATASFTPVCLAVRREQHDGRPRELFYILFDAPAFGRFRDELGRLFVERGGERGTFDPTALSPMMMVASTDSDLASWMPLQADRDGDCRAPLAMQ